MAKSIWGYLPEMIITPPVMFTTPKASGVNVKRLLDEIGTNVTALNTIKMERGLLKPLFKDFDPEKISSAALDKVGKQLYSYGLIDNMTADLMGRAALEFDKYGQPKNPDEEINALEFFARQIDEMKNKSYKGDKYAKMLLPDYTRAVHVMLCLKDFGSTGEGFDAVARRQRERNGEVAKLKPMKTIR